MSESFSLALGDSLPLSLTLPDGASGLFPQAFVYDSLDVAVIGSPFDLSEVGATGRYTNAAFVPLSVGNFAALFIVYSDAGHTTEATTYEHDQDSFVVTLAQAAASGATINTPANSDSTITTGSTVAGDFSETAALDDVYWQIEDAAGTLDMYFEFAISADGSPVSVTMTGRVNGANDSLDVFAWNWGGSTWEQIGELPGQGGPSDVPHLYNLFTTHVGTGANLGKVRIRFFGTGLTGADLYVDQIFLSYAVVTRSVGYADGAIWIDTINGAPGTTAFINGTADNPVDSLANAIVLDSQLSLGRFALAPGSSITLGQAFDNHSFFGDHWTLALGGQSISSAVINGADVSGVCTGAVSPHFEGCDMGVVTVPPCHFHACGLEGAVITLGSAGDYFWDQCYSHTGTVPPTVDFGAAVGTTNLNLPHYSGGVEFENMGQPGTDTVRLEGWGELIVNVNCIGGTITVRGHFPQTDNSGGAVTIIDEGHTADERLKYVWTHAAGDDANKMTHTRASLGSPGSASSDDSLVDQVVTQVDKDTATFEQQ